MCIIFRYVIDESSACPNFQTATDNLEADDFGYTSTFADKLHQNLLKKYESCPVPDIFGKGKRKPAANLEATKARMKESLEHGDDEHVSPGRRSKHKAGDDPDVERRTEDHRAPKREEKSERDREKELERQRRKERAMKAPPPPSYEELLNMAASVKQEAVKYNPLDTAPRNKKDYEFDRPMTAKEKEEHKREIEAKLRREGKLPRKPVAAPTPAKSAETNGPQQPGAKKLGPIPKIASAVTEKKPVPKPTPSTESKKPDQKPSLSKPSVKKEETSAVKVPSASGSSSFKKPPEPYVPQRVTEEYVPKPVTGTYVPKPINGKDVSQNGPSYKATKIAPKAVSTAPKPGPASKTGKLAPTKPSQAAAVVSKSGDSERSAVQKPKPSSSGSSSSLNGKPKIGEKRPAGGMDPWSRLQAERMQAAKKAKPAPPPKRE